MMTSLVGADKGLEDLLFRVLLLFLALAVSKRRADAVDEGAEVEVCSTLLRRVEGSGFLLKTSSQGEAPELKLPSSEIES